MRKVAPILLLVLAVSLVSAADRLTGQEILRKVDDNFGADSKVSESEMKIIGERVTRTVKLRSWTEGTSRSFTEYLAPAREEGTKMLKLDDELWIYTPQTDRIIRISGHMLRQSVMGSDLSYEDLMDDERYSDVYEAEIVREDTVGDRACWVLNLEAREDNVAYHSREIWVDQERFIPLRENRFAKSGKLLKYTEIQSVSRVDGRWYPKRMLFKDVQKGGEGTEFLIHEVSFDVEIPSHIFSKASLRK
jgi:outer membrane lipoprotein-sorting protein